MSREQNIEKFLDLSSLLLGDTQSVFVIFVDLCGSTEYKRLAQESNQPEILWLARQLIFLQRTANTIKKSAGHIVKTMGDAVYAYYSSSIGVEIPLKASIEIVQAFDNIAVFSGESKIDTKISIDFGKTYNGSVIDSLPYDPIGLPVDRCSRLNSVAGPGQIAISPEYLSLLQAAIPEKQLIDRYALKEVDKDLKGLGLSKAYILSAS